MTRYGVSDLRADLLAGITGAVLVLPQGVAFAMIAGLPPIYGLYTAVIAPIVAALFGSSRHTVNGPTTPLSIVVFSTLQPMAEPGTMEFIQLAILMTFIAGLIQLLMGLLRLGSAVNFVSNTVVVGFTAGAAVLIGVSQLKHFLGVEIDRGLSFFKSIEALVHQLPNTQWSVFLVAFVTLVLAILIKKIVPRWPNMLLAMIAGSFLAFYLKGSGAVMTYVGAMPSGFPPFGVPEFEGSTVRSIFTDSLALALLGLIQSVAIARSISAKSGQRLNANQEFAAQGLSNMVGSFFNNYMSGSSFTRSALNYQSGARTPASAIISALGVVGILLFVAPLTRYLPIPVMAGIIMLVAYNLIDFKEIRQVISLRNKEWIILSVTFLSTLFLDLEYAIYFGVILSLVFYLQRTSKPRIIEVAPDPGTHNRKFRYIELYNTIPCPQLDVIRIDGSIFFGATENITDYLQMLKENGKKHLLILGGGINFIDLAGARMLLAESEDREERGGGLYFCGLKKTARDFLIDSGFVEELGREKFFASKTNAIASIYKNLDKDICRSCTVRVFRECAAIQEEESSNSGVGSK